MSQDPSRTSTRSHQRDEWPGQEEEEGWTEGSPRKCDTMPHLVGRARTKSKRGHKPQAWGVAWDGSCSGTSRKGQLSQPPLTGASQLHLPGTDIPGDDQELAFFSDEDTTRWEAARSWTWSKERESKPVVLDPNREEASASSSSASLMPPGPPAPACQRA